MKVTIYDVAKKAGYSIATVSKVINNTGSMRLSTRRKILKVMEELNYSPNIMASALTGKSTETLGLIVPDISNPFFSEIARTIEDQAHERGLSVIMCSTDEKKEKERKYLELLKRKHVDGFIIASSFHDKQILHDLKKTGVPIIMLTQHDPALGVTSVSVDDFAGGYEAASHLLSLEHKNIAVIAENRPSSRMRIYGYQEALESYGLTFDRENIIYTVASIANGKEIIEKISAMAKTPTAIFAFNDLLAIGLMQGARERGIAIPEELSIIGFDDTVLAAAASPMLTTIAQPIDEMGKKVVDILFEYIDSGNQSNERILFKPKLMVRETTSNIDRKKIII